MTETEQTRRADAIYRAAHARVFTFHAFSAWWRVADAFYARPPVNSYESVRGLYDDELEQVRK